MKVWELCNRIAGSNSDYDQVRGWAYSNRIYPDEFVEAFVEAGFISADSVWASELNRLAKSTEIGGVKWLDDFLTSEVKETMPEKTKYYAEISFIGIKKCQSCPLCNDNDSCSLQDDVWDTFAEQMVNCPLKEFNEQQPTPE